MPGFFDEDLANIFVGIGSTIGMAANEEQLARVFSKATKIIFGAGFVPDYHEKPNVAASDWRVYFVRGPRTAQQLNLNPALAISDSGLMVRTCIDRSSYTPSVVSFMPHWESMDRGNWSQACHEAGINLIDPRLPVQSVFKQLLRSKMVICEAMHGAIIADALRIPWVPVIPLNAAHRGKWYDWAESLDIQLRPEALWPSGLGEVGRSTFRHLIPSVMQGGSLSILRPASSANASTLMRWTKQVMMESPASPWVNDQIVDLAAGKLARLAKLPGQLSADSAMDRATTRMLEKLEMLQRDYAYVPYRLAA